MPRHKGKMLRRTCGPPGSRQKNSETAAVCRKQTPCKGTSTSKQKPARHVEESQFLLEFWLKVSNQSCNLTGEPASAVVD
jgi:hypothetical protein